MMAKLALETLVEVEAIRRTIICYAQLLDDGDFEAWGALFVEHAEFCSVPGNHLPGGQDVARLVGRDAIVASVAQAQQVLKARGAVIHFGSSPLIDVEGMDARASWDFVIVHALDSGAQIAFAGRYHATLRLGSDGEWRFVRRISCGAGHELPAWLAANPIATTHLAV
jgi:ketosteroid isomerase-like protein